MGSETGANGRTNPLNTAAGSNPDCPKPKKSSKKSANSVTNFFAPMSKRSKLAAEVVVERKPVEEAQEGKDQDFQEPNVRAVLAAIFDRKTGKKKAKKGKGAKKEIADQSSQLDEEPGEVQPACPIESKNEVLSPVSDKKQASPAKKKRKQQSIGSETKSMVGVHGSDLRMQARLAAEENARLSAGKAPHPFFARPKVGGAKTLVIEEISHFPEGGSLNQASECAVEIIQTSPAKPPHPFFARQRMGGSRSMAVDEASHGFDNGCLVPCPPLHITQTIPEEEAECTWHPRWMQHNVAAKVDGSVGVEEMWLLLRSDPSCTWSWPAWAEKTGWRRPTSKEIGLPQLVAYLLGSNAGMKNVLGEEGKSEAGHIEKLAERMSTYYLPHAKGAHLEHSSGLQMSMEGQEKDVNNSQNMLWTDRYQPQTSQEVCGNRDSVTNLSSWLQSWREKILLQKCVGKKQEQVEDVGSDEDSDFEDSPSDGEDDNGDLHNCLLVTGPVGCGKSAAVYACAMEQGFTVIEVNASECRNGALIKHKFKEAMESHGLSNRPSTIPMDTSDVQEDSELVLKQGETCRRSIFQDEESQSQISLLQGASRSNPLPPSLRRLRVILFEDVDTVFEEDSGFMGALALLARTSKCPIIFTSNSQDPVLPQVRELESIEFEQLSTTELVGHAFMVCMAEGVACSLDIFEQIVKTSGHDLRKLLMLLQFWSQGFPTSIRSSEDSISLPQIPLEELVTGMQNSDLVNCLLQLDGCPQIPATKIQGLKQMSSKHRAEDLGTIEKNGTNPAESAGVHILKDGNESNGRTTEACVDLEWLYAYDSQHRLLPLLFPTSRPCQFTVQLSEVLQGVWLRAMELTDASVAALARRKSDELRVRVEAASQARRTLKKLQAAARREANAKPTDIVSCDVPEESPLDMINKPAVMADMLRGCGSADNPDSAGVLITDGVGHGTDVYLAPDGVTEHVSRDRFDPLTLSEAYDTSRGFDSSPLHLMDKYFISLSDMRRDQSSSSPLCAENSDSQHSHQAMELQSESDAREPVGFSFTKLMQSSYDSPAAQIAIKECNEDTWSILQGCGRNSLEECEGDSPLSDLLRGHSINEMLYPSGVNFSSLALKDLECPKSLQEVAACPALGTENSSKLQGVGSILQQCVNGPSSIPLKQSVPLLAEVETDSLPSPRTSSQNIFHPQRPLEIGSIAHVDALVKEVANLSTPNTTDLTIHIHNDDKTPGREGEQPLNLYASAGLPDRTIASSLMQQTWTNLNKLKSKVSMSSLMGDSVLLHSVLDDISACDILSSLNSAASQDSVSLMRQGRVGDQEHTYGGSRDGCIKSAALLAQLRLNQALNQSTPHSSLLSETLRVGPSVSQQESLRQEKQACRDELVESLLPQRFRLLGAMGRVDYTSYHSRLTPPKGRAVRTHPATRQRKVA